MTRDEILAMPAGREMKELIAELVMGWERSVIWVDGVRKSALVGPIGIDYYDQFPEWPTDIAAAWEVVEKLIEPHNCDCDLTTVVQGWRCVFFGDYSSTAETAPLAICRAALLAVMEAE